MESQTTSICPFCRESVKANARKCPHCHQWQGRWALAYHPAVLVTLLMLPIVAVSLITRHEFGARTSTSGYSDQIAVVESSMHYLATDEKCGPTISVVGKIRNNSDVAWKDIYLEAQYFDSAGAMIDADGGEQYGLVVQPDQEVAFRVRGTAARAQDDYADHQVFVRSARDARSRF